MEEVSYSIIYYYVKYHLEASAKGSHERSCMCLYVKMPPDTQTSIKDSKSLRNPSGNITQRQRLTRTHLTKCYFKKTHNFN